MRRLIVLLAAAMPVALAIGIATVAAGPAPAALAATTCHSPGEWSDFANTTAPQNWYVTKVSGAYEVGLYVNDPQSYSMTWCTVTGAEIGSTSSYYTMYRAEGSDLCATYYGSAQASPSGSGTGVDLQTCDTSTLSQNWLYIQLINAAGTGTLPGLTTEYQISNGTAERVPEAGENISCLSAPDSSDATLVFVDNCNGDGGQTWNWFAQS
jgi:hypothetical protein